MKRFLIIINLTLILLLLGFAFAQAETGTGYVNTPAGLNARTGPGISYTIIETLHDGYLVQVTGTEYAADGEPWYSITWGTGNAGYVLAKRIKLVDNTVPVDEGVGAEPMPTMTAAEFESYMTSQNFPETYKPYLRSMQSAHPSWTFKAAHTGMSWDTVIAKESQVGQSLVYSGAMPSWKSMEKGAYTFNGDKYISYDSGGWYTGSPMIIKYYMDPRNFLNENGIFQFLTHGYEGDTQKIGGLKLLLRGTFMGGAFPEGGYETWADALMEAGKQSGVNPYVLASMILVEQGTGGIGGCISGTVSGYEGYYNFFNINAYKKNGLTAVQMGLKYASESGSYGRPWNSRFSSILGGAQFYGRNYVTRNQNTLYFKKWNVMNGATSLGEHQYMGNVQGAELEAIRLRKGYLNVLNQPMTFIIPVYEGMPSEISQKPTTGNNNNYLDDLQADGFTLDKTFDRYGYEYSVNVDPSVRAVAIKAVANSKEAKIKGAGTVMLENQETRIPVRVTSSSGMERTYYITVRKVQGGQANANEPANAGLIEDVQKSNITLKSALNKGDENKTEIVLTWEKVAEADYYQVFRSNSKNSGFGKSPYYTSSDKETLTFTDRDDFTKGKTYYYKVRGVKEIDGNLYYTKWSNKVWRSIKAGEASLNPAISGIEETTVSVKSVSVKLSNGKKGIKLIWEKSPGYKVDYFEIFRSKKPNSGYGKTPYAKTSDGKKNTYLNSKELVSGHTYYYKVRGVREIDDVKYYTEWSNKAKRSV